MTINLITDGQAKRLAVQFGLTRFYECGAIATDDITHVRTRIRPDDFRDPQGYEADRRALLDYLTYYGPRTMEQFWNLLAPSDAVVPWCYRTQVTMTGSEA